jgi:hypothetical protein
MFVREHGVCKKTQSKVDTLRSVLTKTLPTVIQQVKATKDSSKAREKKDALFYKLLNKRRDTATVISKVDTVNSNLRKLLASNKEAYNDNIVKKNDSLKTLRIENQRLIAAVTLLHKQQTNIIFTALKSLPKGGIKDTTNAFIYAVPFKKSSRQSIFSPQKNYIRIYNKVPYGKVNGKEYYDFEQTNDEINEILIQARANQNFGDKRFLMGIGAELKLNRTGINSSILFNPNSSKPTFNFGLRYDVYRIKFK